MTLSQSNMHDYNPYDVAPVIDMPARTRDGVALVNDLGERFFVNNPIAAGWLLAIFLRRIRSSATLTYMLLPKQGMPWLTLVPGDYVRVTDTEFGLAGFLTRVVTVEIGENWSVSVMLSEYSLDTYDFTLILPELQQRPIMPRPASVALIDNLQLSQTFTGTRDGLIRWTITASWNESVHETFLVLTGPGKRQEARTLSNEYSFDVENAGTWTVTGRHVTRSGMVSGTTVRTLTFDESEADIDEAPMILSTRQHGRILRIVLQGPEYRNVSNVDIRFTSGVYLDAMTAIPVVDEAGWLDAEQMDLSVVNPGVQGQPLIVRGEIPFTARYRIFIRMINRLGNFSPIAEAGIFDLEITGGISLFTQGWPLWPGTRNNLHLWSHASLVHGAQHLLMPSAPSVTLARERWNGERGWPFGPVSSSSGGTFYESETIDLQEEGMEAGVYEVTVSVEFYSPPGVANTITYMVECFQRNNTVETPTQVSFVNGRAAVSLRFFFCRLRLTGGRDGALSRFLVNANRRVN